MPEHDYRRTRLFIGGRSTTPHGEGRIEVVDPATERVIGEVPAGDASDVDAAVDAARRAFDPLVTVEERRTRVARIVEAVERHLPVIAETISRGMGAPVRIAQSVQTQVPLDVARGIARVLDTVELV